MWAPHEKYLLSASDHIVFDQLCANPEFLNKYYADKSELRLKGYVAGLVNKLAFNSITIPHAVFESLLPVFPKNMDYEASKKLSLEPDSVDMYVDAMIEKGYYTNLLSLSTDLWINRVSEDESYQKNFLKAVINLDCDPELWIHNITNEILTDDQIIFWFSERMWQGFPLYHLQQLATRGLKFGFDDMFLNDTLDNLFERVELYVSNKAYNSELEQKEFESFVRKKAETDERFNAFIE